jgi:hypothetical protein
MSDIKELEILKKEIQELKNAIKLMNRCKGFKVPKDHPVFDGSPSNMEMFIREMEFTHPEYTNGENAKRDANQFISKLVPYFKTGSGVQAWFKMYL